MSSRRLARWSLYCSRFYCLASALSYSDCSKWRGRTLGPRSNRGAARATERNARGTWRVSSKYFAASPPAADNLTLHGLEDACKPPLFHADRVDVGITVLSLVHRQFALSELVVDRPQVVVQFEKDGRSNLPTPKIVPTESWQQSLFDLQIRWLELRDGSAMINDRRVPLTAKGQNFEFKLNYEAGQSGADSYIGNLHWKQVELSPSARRAFPLRYLRKVHSASRRI